MNKEKLLKNAMIGDSLLRYTRQEKHEIVTELLKNKDISQRELAKQLGIPYSTVHDWVSLRQDNTGEKIHLSFISVIRKLESVDINTFRDYGRIEQIRELCEDLIRNKPKAYKD